MLNLHKPVFALVDCNSFYASCEKLFRPDLKNRPVVVLSNNDGCIVARSAEAKALGIKMGVPYFQIRPYLEQQGVEVFSSNYALYGDISQRVMTTLEQMAPRVEVYSIDEAFLDLTGMTPGVELAAYGKQVRDRVLQWTGIATCVGISTTKTLAKLANHAAKQYPATGGVVDLTDPARQRRLMGLLPVGEVWGIGRNHAAHLEHLGINTALQLADADPAWIRKQFSVVVERIVLELNGQPCADLQLEAPARQQIMCSRSFASDITDFNTMREAIAGFVSRGAEKLRNDSQTAKHLSVFIRTCPHRDGSRFDSQRASMDMIEPTSDTRRLAKAASELLNSIWKDGLRYKKGGIMLSDLYATGSWQPDLFHQSLEKPGSDVLMRTIDQIHKKGLGRVFLAAQGMKEGYQMRQERLSPRYTTRWADLPVVR